MNYPFGFSGEEIGGVLPDYISFKLFIPPKIITVEKLVTRCRKPESIPMCVVILSTG